MLLRACLRLCPYSLVGARSPRPYTEHSTCQLLTDFGFEWCFSGETNPSFAAFLALASSFPSIVRHVRLCRESQPGGGAQDGRVRRLS